MVVPEFGLDFKFGRAGIYGKVTREYASVSYYANKRNTGVCFSGKFQEVNGKVCLVGNFEKTLAGTVGAVFTAFAIIFMLFMLFLVIYSLDLHERENIGLVLIMIVVFSHGFLILVLMMKTDKVNESLIDQELKRILCS